LPTKSCRLSARTAGQPRLPALRRSAQPRRRADARSGDAAATPPRPPDTPVSGAPAPVLGAQGLAGTARSHRPLSTRYAGDFGRQRQRPRRRGPQGARPRLCAAGPPRRRPGACIPPFAGPAVRGVSPLGERCRPPSLSSSLSACTSQAVLLRQPPRGVRTGVLSWTGYIHMLPFQACECTCLAWLWRSRSV